MEEILQQLIGSYSIIYKVLYIPGGAGFLPSAVSPSNEASPLSLLHLGQAAVLRDLALGRYPHMNSQLSLGLELYTCFFGNRYRVAIFTAATTEEHQY